MEDKEDAPKGGTDGAARASRSSIKASHIDLKEVTGMARSVKDTYGSQCGFDQLAALIGTTTSSGTFRTKVAAAKTFGVFSGRRGAIVELTDLGNRIADADDTAAKVEAFLNVPLYQALYDKHSGGLLPGNSGLEQEMIRLGVNSNSAGRIRQVFQRSAEFAGFFGQGQNRLVKPPAAMGSGQEDEAVEPDEHTEEAGQTTPNPGIDSRMHPLLEGLWASLPHQGEPFTSQQQENWIQMATLALKMVYGGTRDDEEPF